MNGIILIFKNPDRKLRLEDSGTARKIVERFFYIILDGLMTFQLHNTNSMFT
jgi:hypothetical protein